MRKKGFKGRCDKRTLAKCKEVCRTYDPIQYAYADKLQENADIKEIRCNVPLDGLPEGDYMSDFVCIKGAVEKFFDLIQTSFKAHLKGKGVIEPDYQERGAHDYRKDACLTMQDFEKIIIHCIKMGNKAFGSRASREDRLGLVFVPIPHVFRCDLYTM